jgi:hypothetical protein
MGWGPSTTAAPPRDIVPFLVSLRRSSEQMPKRSFYPGPYVSVPSATSVPSGFDFDLFSLCLRVSVVNCLRPSLRVVKW